MALHVSSTCAHHQEVKIALHSLWYLHTDRWTVPCTGPVLKTFELGMHIRCKLNWGEINQLIN